ncbi:hypothetical protein AXF42_Ash001560 [Apostasia shenzhenica]|uniref:ETFB lysine methyltransferase n=1 Tax=Apostasia shenzhenica TaxID=1088818 RepID=A0A2I0AAK0_9ASPA|nr:hypothetical protein AXF42_Ash001560 [Apostasia shenzhenica]
MLQTNERLRDRPDGEGFHFPAGAIEMLGRLRLLRRFCCGDISTAGYVMPFTCQLPMRSLSSPSRPPRRDYRGQVVTSRLSFQLQRKKRREKGFCRRAAEMDDGQIFWPHSSVRIRCSKDVTDTLSEALLCFGASSVSMDDKSSSDNPSEETFVPIEIKNGLWIVPKWRCAPVQDATNIILNPGLAFGTGEHPTTKLCLLLLHGMIKGGEKFLDYGTGSGVLGIAALKMGAELSIGIDVDPQAVTAARQNCALNEIRSDKMRVYLVSQSHNSSNNELSFEKEKFDIVIANILLNPLLDLAHDIVSFGKPGAVIAVSGIISEQIQQIKECYSVYLENILVAEMDGWACVHGIKMKSLIHVC